MILVFKVVCGRLGIALLLPKQGIKCLWFMYNNQEEQWL
ncbi:hypothetical protein VCHA56P521_30085 [Vibrio chagasii]|nr:hypothetical protein VCHA56P521_30085 [Vibrio chagasii]